MLWSNPCGMLRHSSYQEGGHIVEAHRHAVQAPHLAQRERTGWIAVALIALVYALLFALNLLLPLGKGLLYYYSNYTSRIWAWTEYALGAAALVVLLRQWRAVRVRSVLLAVVLAALSTAGRYARNRSVSDVADEMIILILTFLAGVVLFANLQERRVAAFQGAPWDVLRSIGWGIVLSVPLAVVNNLYFYLTSGSTFEFTNVFQSGLRALNPAISEEVIFRFFVMGLTLSLLRGTAHKKLAVGVAVVLGVVPHSLNHLPDLFLINPASALFLLAATSVAFGLPMALIQLKRNLESAMGFHWFIDFARFLMGF